MKWPSLTQCHFSFKDGSSLVTTPVPLAYCLTQCLCAGCWRRDCERSLSPYHLIRELNYSTGLQNTKSSFHRCRPGPWHSSTVLYLLQMHTIEDLQAGEEIQNPQLWCEDHRPLVSKHMGVVLTELRSCQCEDQVCPQNISLMSTLWRLTELS